MQPPRYLRTTPLPPPPPTPPRSPNHIVPPVSHGLTLLQGEMCHSRRQQQPSVTLLCGLPGWPAVLLCRFCARTSMPLKPAPAARPSTTSGGSLFCVFSVFLTSPASATSHAEIRVPVGPDSVTEGMGTQGSETPLKVLAPVCPPRLTFSAHLFSVPRDCLHAGKRAQRIAEEPLINKFNGFLRT